MFVPFIYKRIIPEEKDRCSMSFLGKKVNEDLAFGGYVGSGVIYIFFPAALIINFFYLVKILIAPRLYIIEYFLN